MRSVGFYSLTAFDLISCQHIPCFSIELASITTGKNFGDEIKRLLVAAEKVQLIDSMNELLEVRLVGARSKGQINGLVNVAIFDLGMVGLFDELELFLGLAGSAGSLFVEVDLLIGELNVEQAVDVVVIHGGERMGFRGRD